ncbi:hypothetical protein EBX93_02320, partial [bacterium]|nr:hypothetical protein [bacterium]
MRLRSILWALALCGAGWTPESVFSEEPIKSTLTSQAEKSNVKNEEIPSALPNLIPAPDFKSPDKPFEPSRPADSSKPLDRPLV